MEQQLILRRLQGVKQANGFFYFSLDMRNSSSPDAFGPAGILLEVKTGAENCSGSLEPLDNYPQDRAVSVANALYRAEFCVL